MSVPQLDPQLRQPLRFDLVNKIHDYETIGNRYGLGGKQGLEDYLRSDPEFCAEVGKMRALVSSDMGAEKRCRLKAAIASEELVARIAGIVANPATAGGVAIDGFKQLNRMAGVDGIPAASKDGHAQVGTAFTINFQFSGGRTETLTTTIVEAQAIAPPPDEDEILVEDV